MLLLNKKIIISAGASGIGWATAKVLDQRGAQVFLCDINEKRIQKINKNKKIRLELSCAMLTVKKTLIIFLNR